jgi:large subunit ribosomal protein L13
MTTKTFRLSAKAMDRPWHVIDARGRPLGRVASEAAQLLMGKHKPTYERHLPMGDFVIVVNAREVAITGNKAQQKVYYRHSGYPGGLKERRFFEQMEKDPRRVIEKAVKGMLPSTSLGRELFRHLKVYAGPTHPHEAQVRAGMSARPRQRPAAVATPATAEPAPPAEDEAPPAEEPTTAVDTLEEPAAIEATNESDTGASEEAPAETEASTEDPSSDAPNSDATEQSE